MSEHRAGARPATFAAWLRTRTDGELAALFGVRPDLITPVPADFTALASRAASRPSVLRALDRLDAAALNAAVGLVALSDSGGAVGEPRLAAALGGDDPALKKALAILVTSALAWTDADGLHPVAVLTDLLPRPAGLGPPLSSLRASLPPSQAARLAPPEHIGARVHEAGSDAAPVLDRLAWGPPEGTVADARRDPVGASPIDRLLALGLIAPADDSTVVLPREVGLHLREGRMFRESATEPAPLTTSAVAADKADRAAAGQAFTVIRSVEELLGAWEADPPGVLRSGGLGVRDLRRAAARLDTDEATAALFIETAHAAGLLGADDGVNGEWLPTRAFDVWREREPERRWIQLAQGWLESTRVPSLAGSKDARGRSRPVLGDGLDRRSAPEVRRDVLGVVASAGPGRAPTEESSAERLAWLRPRRQGPAYTVLVDATAAEARALGITGRGALAAHSRALLDESAGGAAVAEAPRSRTAALLAEELPRPLDTVLVQGDMTAVAPGPLIPALAEELALVADVESTGGATVYRFGAASVRRALDAGRAPADIIGFLERHSTTPLPQALRYLVEDTGRTHARLRVGSASGYLRSEDTGVLDELMSDRSTTELGLLRLAPTVVASRSSRRMLLDRLTELGYHPVTESGDGTLRLSAPEHPRADARPLSGDLAEPPPPGPEVTAAAVRAVRAGDEAANAIRRPVAAPDSAPPRSPTATVLSALSDAAARGDRVWIGYLDADGRASNRIIEPARLEGGYLTAYDATRAAVLRFAVHRISGIASLDESEADAGA